MQHFGNGMCVHPQVRGGGQLCFWNRFFLIGIVAGGVQLGPLGTAATNRPIVPSPGDYDD
jgi:hypothetical protein